MKVTLIDYTQDAIEKLLYTKATRLTQGAETRQRINQMDRVEKLKELDYMANTVPSSWEFVNYTFEILDVTRAFTHQLVRTRTGSYAQQAMRICKMEQFGYRTGPSITGVAECLYKSGMEHIQSVYDQLLEMGVKPEDARGILPTNIHTNIIAQFNLRTFADLVKKRTSLRAQDEYREFMELAVASVLEVHPWAQKFLIPDRLSWIKELQQIIDQHTILQDTDKLSALKLLDLLK